MHSVRLEPTKPILVGSRATYQATGDAGMYLTFLADCQSIHKSIQGSYSSQTNFKLKIWRQLGRCSAAGAAEAARLRRVPRESVRCKLQGLAICTAQAFVEVCQKSWRRGKLRDYEIRLRTWTEMTNVCSLAGAPWAHLYEQHAMRVHHAHLYEQHAMSIVQAVQYATLAAQSCVNLLLIECRGALDVRLGNSVVKRFCENKR